MMTRRRSRRRSPHKATAPRSSPGHPRRRRRTMHTYRARSARAIPSSADLDFARRLDDLVVGRKPMPRAEVTFESLEAAEAWVNAPQVGYVDPGPDPMPEREVYIQKRKNAWRPDASSMAYAQRLNRILYAPRRSRGRVPRRAAARRPVRRHHRRVLRGAAARGDPSPGDPPASRPPRRRS